MLTEKEKQFLNILEATDNDSIWGIAISNVVKNPEPHLVRRLITSLKEQAHDCREVMLSIIGEPGMHQLQNL